MSLFAFIASICFFAFAEYLDAKTSRYFLLTEPGEKNPFARTDYGYYSLTKSLRNTLIVGGIFIIIGLLPSFTSIPGQVQWGVAGGLAALATWIFVVARRNASELAKKRKAQEGFLQALADDPAKIQKIDSWSVWELNTKKDGYVFVYSDFRDIRTPILQKGSDGKVLWEERERGAVELRKLFLTLSEHPEWWWRLDRSELIK